MCFYENRAYSDSRRFGIPPEEVAELFAALPSDRMPSRRDWARIVRLWHARLGARRREVEQLESELTGFLGCGCLSLSSSTLRPFTATLRNSPRAGVPELWFIDPAQFDEACRPARRHAPCAVREVVDPRSLRGSRHPAH
ncbi:MerR family DNA-binding protein [Nocardioides sp. NPDC051685]|uniref:MerR family DNA-binding protein n=1 Tax=Nocardioides sp. NPDC051685 TaxID=3364334 RepID=UPI003793DD62